MSERIYQYEFRMRAMKSLTTRQSGLYGARVSYSSTHGTVLKIEIVLSISLMSQF